VLSSYKKATLAIVNLVNGLMPSRQRYLSPETADISDDLIQQLSDAVQAAYDHDLVLPSVAEVSARKGDKCVITRHKADLLELTHKTIGNLNIEDDALPDWAPVHAGWHKAIYRTTDSAAVLFCQPVDVMAAAMAGISSFVDVMPAVEDIVGGISFVESETEIPDSVSLYNHHVFIIPRVGVFVHGDNLQDTVQRADAVLYLCRLALAG